MICPEDHGRYPEGARKTGGTRASKSRCKKKEQPLQEQEQQPLKEQEQEPLQEQEQEP